MLLISKIDYLVWKKFAVYAYIVSIGLQIWSLVNGLSEGGASRWIEIGGVNFQPSELLKIATVMYLAFFLEKRKKPDEYPRVEGESNFVRFFRFISSVIDNFMFSPKYLGLASLLLALILYFLLGVQDNSITKALSSSKTLNSVNITTRYNSESFEVSGADCSGY